MQQQQLKYILPDIVEFVFQSQIQICCAFFKWSDSSEDVGKQKNFVFLKLGTLVGAVNWVSDI